MWTRSLECCVPVASSSMVYDCCPSTETNVPHDHRAFFSWRFFINMSIGFCSSLSSSPLFSLSFALSACFTLLWPALMLLVLSNRLSGIEGRSDLTFLWNISSNGEGVLESDGVSQMFRRTSSIDVSSSSDFSSNLLSLLMAFSQRPFFHWEWEVPGLWTMLNFKQSSWKSLEVYCDPRSPTTSVE